MERQPDKALAPWGEAESDSAFGAQFDLDQIQAGGELIVLTLTGPGTCYDYHGRKLGQHAMLAQRFASQLGVGLRIETCRDTAEMLQKLDRGDADLIACQMVPGDSLGWQVGPGKEQLQQELQAWFRPALIADVQREEQELLSTQRVKRHVFSPMLNRKGGVISRYDALFVKYCRPIRWDWRLMAAQCYQESTFDPNATSFAGAKGLMQIMPATADLLGLPREQLYEAEPNIAAAAKYLAQLEAKLSDIPGRSERLKFVLACYNGGIHHISDARALARRDGKDDRRWDDVAEYVLRLQQPKYYNDPMVAHGYMRGSETVDYVKRILDRWQAYRHVKTPRTGYTPRRSTKKNPGRK